MNWLAIAAAAAFLCIFAYSVILWLRMRRDGSTKPSDIARHAVRQERWMTVGLFGLGSALVWWSVRHFQ